MSSYVFVSHANLDKGAIRHIVDALIAAKRKVWLDNPAAMGYSLEAIEAHFHLIHAGRPWRDEINEALRQSGAVLVCWSRHATVERDVWMSEANYARTEGKLVSCRIDDFEAASLPDGFKADQIPDLRVERPGAELTTALALLVKDIDRVLAETGRTQVVRRKTRRRDDFAPYLVDRVDQEQRVVSALEVITETGGVETFCIAGPENECPDEFIDRIERSGLSGGRKQRRSLRRLLVEWPSVSSGRDFIAAYRCGLARALGLPLRSSEKQIAAALIDKSRPALALSLLVANDWRLDEDKRIAVWLELWRAIAAEPGPPAALPILCLRLPPAEPGWTAAPPGRADGAALSNAEIWRSVERMNRKPGFIASLFGAQPAERAPLTIPPMLHPVNMTHAETWLKRADIANQLKGDLRDAAAHIADLFKSRDAARNGVPLQRFAAAMSRIFSSG